MRLILTTIMLTLLAQPVWANSIEYLLDICTKWKRDGYSEAYNLDTDGIQSIECATYMTAMRDVGVQNCQLREFASPNFGWDASTKQLTQFFLNRAWQYPEQWEYSGYSFFMMNKAHETFPCKE